LGEHAAWRASGGQAGVDEARGQRVDLDGGDDRGARDGFDVDGGEGPADLVEQYGFVGSPGVPADAAKREVAGPENPTLGRLPLETIEDRVVGVADVDDDVFVASSERQVAARLPASVRSARLWRVSRVGDFDGAGSGVGLNRAATRSAGTSSNRSCAFISAPPRVGFARKGGVDDERWSTRRARPRAQRAGLTGQRATRLHRTRRRAATSGALFV
jgi:hypothetical protein